MIRLEEYILEKKQPIVTKLRTLITKNLKAKGIKKGTTGQADYNELYRLYLTNDDKENRKIISDILSGTDIKLLDIDAEIIGREKGGSSQYYSYTVEYDGKKYFIANATKNTEKGILHNKDLTPNKILINLSDSKNTFDFDSLLNSVYNGLDKINDENHKNIVELCKRLIYSLGKNKIEKEGSFEEKNLDDFFNSTKPGQITIDLANAKDLLNLVSKPDLKCIEKDFGEILGPFLFFRLFPNCKVIYPTAANEALVDYWIDGHKVSAKQLQGGGMPSGSNLMLQSVASLEKKAENEMDDIKKEKDEMNKQEKKAMYTNEEIEFINNVAKSYSLSTFEQKKFLINHYIIENNKYNSKLPSSLKSSFNTLKKDKTINEQITKLVGPNIKDFFDKLYNAINYPTNNVKKKSYWNVERIVQEWNNVNYKEGILFYPLWAVCINELNEIYGKDDNDIISSVIQKAIDMKQVYFGIQKNTMKLQVFSSSVSKWSFEIGGISTPNIDNAKLSIHMHKTK